MNTLVPAMPGEALHQPLCQKCFMLSIAVLMILPHSGFGQGSTITLLNTQDTPGTPITLTVAGGPHQVHFPGRI